MAEADVNSEAQSESMPVLKSERPYGFKDYTVVITGFACATVSANYRPSVIYPRRLYAITMRLDCSHQTIETTVRTTVIIQNHRSSI